ncbi:rod shape-determining protein MreD [Candidatus Clostridium radicumherbarum]|uniref:Rod shape-determining protein MreD n=1 Tax=Candidatus Clostridium radicumherbarum TaxID=3381662 RepID=A0ABW8TQM0_9CLOT
MKKVLTLFFICVLLFILDNTLVPFFAIRGFFPSLLLAFCILYSIINGSIEGLWLGVFAGILQDLYFYHGFGINGFTNMLVCAAAGLIGSGIFKEKALIPIVSSLGLSFIKGVLVFSILYINSIYMPFSKVVFNSLYNMAIAAIMYRLVYKLCQKEYMQRKWSFYDGR